MRDTNDKGQYKKLQKKSHTEKVCFYMSVYFYNYNNIDL